MSPEKFQEHILGAILVYLLLLFIAVCFSSEKKPKPQPRREHLVRHRLTGYYVKRPFGDFYEWTDRKTQAWRMTESDARVISDGTQETHVMHESEHFDIHHNI